MSKLKVGILGATGAVGQRFVSLLDSHPWFEVEVLAASERSSGKKYTDAANWILKGDIPEYARDMKVVGTEPKECGKVDLVFSALPSAIAAETEQKFLDAGYFISSNSASFRMHSDVPLVIPEVNPEHLKLLETQKWKGRIVTNPNCSAIQLVIALKPLQDKFGLEKVSVTTMQALSGAGYPGVPSLAIISNVIPYIENEEEKVETEPLKILGKLDGNKVKNETFAISASCNRVAVQDGHFESVSVKLKKPATVHEIEKCLSEFRGAPQELKLPTAPEKPIIVRKEKDRPQPSKDLADMAIIVGRVREDKVLDFKFNVLGHNTVRGAAGAAVLNAELLKAKGYIG